MFYWLCRESKSKISSHSNNNNNNTSSSSSNVCNHYIRILKTITKAVKKKKEKKKKKQKEHEFKHSWIIPFLFLFIPLAEVKLCSKCVKIVYFELKFRIFVHTQKRIQNIYVVTHSYSCTLSRSFNAFVCSFKHTYTALFCRALNGLAFHEHIVTEHSTDQHSTAHQT